MSQIEENAKNKPNDEEKHHTFNLYSVQNHGNTLFLGQCSSVQHRL